MKLYLTNLLWSTLHVVFSSLCDKSRYTETSLLPICYLCAVRYVNFIALKQQKRILREYSLWIPPYEIYYFYLTHINAYVCTINTKALYYCSLRVYIFAICSILPEARDLYSLCYLFPKSTRYVCRTVPPYEKHIPIYAFLAMTGCTWLFHPLQSLRYSDHKTLRNTML